MRKFYAILSLTLLCSASSFAIDQVTLATGEVLEGKVLADVPNRHVDIQLVNGEKKRFPKSQVMSVERDVPSNKDQEMFGANRRIFAGVVAGGVKSTVSGSDLSFIYGAKLGYNAGNLGGALFSPVLGYRRYSASTTGTISGFTGTFSESINLITAGFLFRRISNSGFYFGPQLGLSLYSIDRSVTSPVVLTSSSSTSNFMLGANVGWEIQFSDSFSLGPDVMFDHLFGSAIDNLISFGLLASFHFE